MPIHPSKNVRLKKNTECTFKDLCLQYKDCSSFAIYAMHEHSHQSSVRHLPRGLSLQLVLDLFFPPSIC